MSHLKLPTNCLSNIQHGVKTDIITAGWSLPLLAHQRDGMHCHILLSRGPIRDYLIMAQHMVKYGNYTLANVSKNIYYEKEEITVSCRNIGDATDSPASPVTRPLISLS